MIRITYISEHDGQEHVVYAQTIHANEADDALVGIFAGGGTREFKEVTSIEPYSEVFVSGLSTTCDAAKAEVSE